MTIILHVNRSKRVPRGPRPRFEFPTRPLLAVLSVIALTLCVGAAYVPPGDFDPDDVPHHRLIDGSIHQAVIVVRGFEALRLLNRGAPAAVLLSHGNMPGDGLGGEFWQDPTDTSTPDDGSNVIVAGKLRWKRMATLGVDLTFSRDPATLSIGGSSSPDGMRIDYNQSLRTAHILGGNGPVSTGTGLVLFIQGQQAIGAQAKGGPVEIFAGTGSNGAAGGDTTLEAGISLKGRGGNTRIAGGDSGGDQPGYVEIVGGNGSTSTGWGFLGFGNMAIGQGGTGWNLSDWHGMVRGVFLHEADAAPSGNPQRGGFLFIDPADHKLKFRGQSGTVTAIADP